MEWTYSMKKEFVIALILILFLHNGKDLYHGPTSEIQLLVVGQEVVLERIVGLNSMTATSLISLIWMVGTKSTIPMTSLDSSSILHLQVH